MTRFIDAHCHLSDPRVFDRADELIASGVAAGLEGFLLGGTDPEEWGRQRELARRHPGRVFPCVGLHPWWVDGLMGSPDPAAAALDRALERLREQAVAAHAIGETGLDGARGRLKRSREAQLRSFEAHLDLARALGGKPLVLHVVRAHPLALEVLERPGHRGLTGMIHSFSGARQDARRYLDLGWLLSFSARITHPEAAELRGILRDCPADRLLFETDSPDQPPFAAPGGEAAARENHSPVSLFKVVQKAAEIRNEPMEGLLARSGENLVRVFKL